MTPLEHALADAYALFARGALTEARTRLAPWAEATEDVRLDVMLGQILLAMGEPAAAAPRLARALAAAPGNTALRLKAAAAHHDAGDMVAARRLVVGEGAPEFRRILAFVDWHDGMEDAAIAGLRATVAAFPNDHESHSLLGALLTTRDPAEAVAACYRALALSPTPLTYRRASAALAAAARFAERVDVLRQAIEAFPLDPDLAAELGLAQGAVDAFDAAEQSYRRALALAPQRAATYLDFGMLLERLNRYDDLAALVKEGDAAGVPHTALAFLRATLSHRAGAFHDALGELESATDGVSTVRLAKLIGDVRDAIGDADGAFAAWGEMNEASAAEPAARAALRMNYLGEVRAAAARLTAEAVAARHVARASDAVPPPAFILGFPRSGTTLIDTMLRNAGELQVLEEPPMLEQVEREFGGPAQLLEADIDVLTAARDRYAEKARQFTEVDPSRTLVDKFPLHLSRAETIYRLFPDGRIIFVQRHPCDVILSCFAARFQPNKAMVLFQDLHNAAALYDAALTTWSRACEMLPLTVYLLRYEDMVARPAATMRGVADFLKIAWSEALIDNVAAAAGRRHVATASYAQVTQPVHERSVARWRRYERHLASIMPVLAPWIERLGYEA